MNYVKKYICALLLCVMTLGCFGVNALACPNDIPEEGTIVLAPLVEDETELYIDIDELEEYERAARYIAKTVYGEARGKSTTVQAAVIWTILNRVDQLDSQTSNDIVKVITKKGQFHGYKKDYPILEEHFDLAIDVLSRWLAEKNGYENVGRVLPKEYTFFAGYGTIRFRDKYKGDYNYWDWSLESPYVEEDEE